MGAGKHCGFGHTKGNIKNRLKLNLQFFASKVFEAGGHVSEKSFSENTFWESLLLKLKQN